MATIYVGSARVDENGNLSGGAAGDQTGKEVSTQTFYISSKGWHVLRPKSATHADDMATLMKKACNNANIGYDQGNRLGIIKYGISTTTKTECDCSSLVREVVKEATGKDPGNFTTANEATVLAATGLFETKFSYVSQSKTPVYNGDVLVTKSKGHTVIVVSGNPRSSTSSTATTGSLTVDGQIGAATVKKLQSYLGTTVDGVISGQLPQSKKYFTSISGSVCSWSGGASAMVKVWQKLVGASADGKLGKETAKAIQTYLIGKGYSCGSSGADGYFGTNSAKALQKWLNAQ